MAHGDDDGVESFLPNDSRARANSENRAGDYFVSRVGTRLIVTIDFDCLEELKGILGTLVESGRITEAAAEKMRWHAYSLMCDDES